MLLVTTASIWGLAGSVVTKVTRLPTMTLLFSEGVTVTTVTVVSLFENLHACTLWYGF